MNSTALLYAFGVVLCWGCYSVLLHMGSEQMGPPSDMPGNRMKSFLLVGVAYFIVAIVGPLIIMKIRGTAWQFPTGGWTWSLVAGLAGAIGAFFLLMALSSGRSMQESKFVLPLIVPAIVFAGAPIVNTIVSTTKTHNWGYVNWKFIAGIILAAAGTAMVMKYKPAPPVQAAPAGAPAAPAGPAISRFTAPPVPVRAVAPGYVDVTTRSYYVS